MAEAPIRIIHISDTHLLADPNKELLGVKTRESFNSVVDLLKQEVANNKVDLILHSGDISQDDSRESYLYFAEVMKPLNVPVYCVPGNHDDPDMMLKVFPRDTVSHHRHIVLPNWHIILLNSQKPGAVEGRLDQSQLSFLQHCLQQHPELHTIVVFHHQPVFVGSQWLDKLALTNAAELWNLLGHFPKVNTLLFGHVHQEFAQIKNEVKCYSVPSTCIQFMHQQDHFGLEKLPPGYRWLNLYPDGDVQTAVQRAAEYVGVFDEHAKGY